MPLDLNSLVPNLVDLGFELAGQIQVSATYTHRTAAVYDPATGASTDSTETATPKPILKTYKQSLIDGERVKVGDREAVIRMSEIKSISVKAKEDVLTIGDDDWSIVNFKIDPTGTVMIAQIRKVA